MKNLYAFFALILFSNPLFAQTIENGSFEDWSLEMAYETDTLDHWKTVYDYFNETQPAVESNVAKDGNSSLLMEPSDYGIFNVKYEMPFMEIEPNVVLRGYYQAEIASGDSAEIAVIYKAANGDELTRASHYVTASANSWTFFQLDLKRNGNADSIVISLRPSFADLETKFWVDDLAFDQFVSTKEAIGYNIEAYPNPAENVLFIQYNGKTPIPSGMRLLDLNGREVKRIASSGLSSGNALKVDLNGVENGMYLLEMSGSHGTHVEKVLIR